MLAYSRKIQTPKLLVIRHGDDNSCELNKYLYNEIYSILKKSKFIEDMSYDVFWDEVDYEDLSSLKTDRDIDSAYDNLLLEYKPDFVFLFGLNPIDGLFLDWSEFKLKRVLCGLKIFRSETNLHRIENQLSYQISLQDPLSKDYSRKAMIKLLHWFGDRYCS